jgi:hypothetical protein
MFLEDNISKGLIRKSKSTIYSPLVIVKKKNGENRICIDFRQLNTYVTMDYFGLPLIADILRDVEGHQWYSEIDLRAAYNQLRINKGKEYLTALLTLFGLFEYIVMLFGLCTFPSHFQRTIADVLEEKMGKGVRVYFAT